MKIAIFPNYGGVYVPPFLEKQLKSDNWIHQRIELANLIEQLEPTHTKITQKVYSEYANSICSEIQFYDYIKDNENSNIIYVKNMEDMNNFIYEIKLIDVDISRIWKLDSYDGGEYITYFHKPKIIDKNLNYGIWR